MNESCPTLHIWVMSRNTCMNESCLRIPTKMSHIPRHVYEWVMSWNAYTNESRPTIHTRISHVVKYVHEWVISHITRMNESCRGKYMNESRLSFEWVMSVVWMSHVCRMNESCLSHMNESCPTTHVWMSHVVGNVDIYACVSSWLTHDLVTSWKHLYTRLQTGWQKILRSLLKYVQRTRILPVRFAISTRC